MNEFTHPPTADSPALAFPSLAALRAAHGELLKGYRASREAPEILEAAAAFIRQGQAIGALLDADGDRALAQSLLDYWVTVLYRAGQEPPEAALPDFDPSLAPELPDALCPYLGLDAFHEPHAPLFFGRQRLVADMIYRLADHRLLAVVGPSGSGKSSIVRAGLLSALRGGVLPGSQNWRYFPPIVPGSDPLTSLARLVGGGDGQQVPVGVEAFQQDQGRLARLIAESGDVPAVLVVDQFEETFTLCEDEQARQAFIGNLVELIQASGVPHRVILTMRSDFEPFVARSPLLLALFEAGRAQVTPLGAAELREAIERPAEAVGLKFEAGVIDALLQDILGEPAALPLLQFTLLKLWEQREHNRVTWAAYQRVGGGRLALARSADAFYSSLIPEEQVTARRILLRMVRPGEGLEVTSRRVRRADLYRGGEDPGRVERVLTRLVVARLLRLTVAEAPGDDQVEVAHEALVRNWPLLVDWLEEERAALAIRRRLEGRATEWERLGRGSGGLLDEVELSEAERWLASSDAAYLGYAESLPALVRASRELARTLAEAQTRTASRLRNTAFVLLILLILALGAAGVAVYQSVQTRTLLASANDARATADAERSRAEEQRQIAERNATEAHSLALAASARQALSNDNTDLATALALAANRVDRPSDQAQNTLAAAAYTPGTRLLFERRHSDWVWSVAFSPDGRMALSGSKDKSLILWDVASGHEIRRFEGHTGEVWSVAFSPDGRTAMTGSSDHYVILWDIASGKVIRRFEHPAGVWSAVFSPDGRTILTGSQDHLVRLWDVASGHEIRRFEGHTDEVTSVAFSPDGRMALSGSNDRAMILWDLASGAQIHRFEGHAGLIRSVAFSPDGHIALSGSADSTAILWDIESGMELHRLAGHTSWIFAVAFSPDGRTALTGSSDDSMILWDVASGKRLQRYAGHTDEVSSVAFSPDGRTVLSGSRDRTIRLWDIDSGDEMLALDGQAGEALDVAFSPDGSKALSGFADTSLRMWDIKSRREIRSFKGHTGWVWSVAFSPDGQTAVSGSSDHTLILWDVATGNQLHPALKGHTDEILSVAFSPDGGTVLSGSRDNSIRLWDVATGRELRRFDGHTDWVQSVAFSPDGGRVLSGSRDNSIRLWDVATGRELRRFDGHTNWVWGVAMSPDGRTALSASHDGSVCLWDLDSGNRVKCFVGYGGSVSSVAFSPDGRKAVSGSSDGKVRLWDIESGAEFRRFAGHSNWVTSVAFNSDGQTVLSSSNDGKLILWQVTDTLDGLVKWVRDNRYARELTCEERKLYDVAPLCNAAPTATP